MKIPQIGLGTWELRGSECTKVVSLALELGYRHIDTAHVYQNHDAIKKAIHGFDRTQLYLTSKIAVDEQIDLSNIEASVEKACNQALKELGTDYLDLYLIHWPVGEFELERVFLAMEKLQGKVKRVGVSNYTINHLKDLIKAGGKPTANQVEFHPYLFQKELLEFCRSSQIELISFRPFGKGKLIKEEPLFAQIGAKYNKSGGQVILRWLIQKQIPVIPKASSKKHLKENLEIFDFLLSEADMKQLDNLHQNKRYCGEDEPIYEY